MADIYYNFSAATDGAGTPEDPKNTWVTPNNDDNIFIRRECLWIRLTQLNFSTRTNITVSTYYNDDGSDDETKAKPIIQHASTSTFTWNFAGDGIHTIKNLVFSACTSNTFGAIIGSGLVAASGRYASLFVDNCEFYDIGHNAIRTSNSTTANAALSIRVTNCIFDRIGEDAVYGGALQYEFGWNVVRNVSYSSETGDGVGFIGANPVKAWIHDNLIDRTGFAFKHCIIIDTETVGQGFALIENNELIGSTGFGVNNTTIINVECKAIIRENDITVGDVAINLVGGSSEVYSNVVHIKENLPSTVIALVSNGNDIYNNTIIGAEDLNINNRCVVQGGVNSGNSVLNNIFVRINLAVRSDNSGDNPAVNNNCFFLVNTPYTNSLTGDFSGTGDVFNDPQFMAGYLLQSTSPCVGAGAHNKYCVDKKNKQFYNPPSIGAYEYERPRISRT